MSFQHIDGGGDDHADRTITFIIDYLVEYSSFDTSTTMNLRHGTSWWFAAMGMMALSSLVVMTADAFVVQSSSRANIELLRERRQTTATVWMAQDDNEIQEKKKEEDPLQAVINAMYGGQPLTSESPQETRARIQNLVESHPVLLFMKGSKQFPQCGFSDTATKILETLNVDFYAVDVLSDEAIRQGIKEYSQWPTIPQLYVRKEFIGGSDIMLEMYQNGELAELLKGEEK